MTRRQKRSWPVVIGKSHLDVALKTSVPIILYTTQNLILVKILVILACDADYTAQILLQIFSTTTE